MIRTIDNTFVGRRSEIRLLDRLWRKPGATMLVLYGRRRVGKTRLLTYWQQQNSEDMFYWVAEQRTRKTQLDSLATAIYKFENPGRRMYGSFAFKDWEEAFGYFAEIAKDRKITIIIDEFTYLVDADREIVATLQRMWDQELKNSNIKLILSGSHMTIMHDELLAYDKPLYGRAEIENLSPLIFSDTLDYFPDRTAEERLIIYSMVGGIPAYWERFLREESIRDIIAHVMLGTTMREEPAILLRDHIDNTSVYQSVLEAIAQGYNSMGQILEATGLESKKRSLLGFYLTALRKSEFVEKFLPLTQPNSKTRTKYRITDPFLRFFYSHVAPNTSLLAQGNIRHVLNTIEEALPEFIGQYTWPELCQEWLLKKSANGEIEPIDVGSEWNNKGEIQILGISQDETTAYIGGTRWHADPTTADDLEAFINNATNVFKKKMNVVLMFFSKSDYDQSAVDFAKMPMKKRLPKGWKIKDFWLQDLKSVDDDLYRLSNIDLD